MWSRTRPSSVGGWLVLAGTAALLASCAFNFAMTPYFECLLLWGGNCTEPGHGNPLTGAYARSTSAACFVSTAVMWLRYGGAVAAYGVRVRAHDVYMPTTVAERRCHVAFCAAVLVAYIALTVPVNSVCVSLLVLESRPAEVTVYFVCTYTHNVISCLWEARFVALCYPLYTRFAKVNRDIEAIGCRIVDPATGGRADDREITVKRDDLQDDDGNADLWVATDQDDAAGDYVYRSRRTGRPLADAIERLKIRHRLIRDAVEELKYAFATPVGSSLCNLCVMALIDVYEHTVSTYVMKIGQMNIAFICVWLTQYVFRFFVIVTTVHATTKQALRSKQAVSFVNRNFLDISTKEELQVFFNQLSSSSLEFTICDLFTLNTQLFTSAFGACVTYLVIILQMKSV